MPLSVSSSWEKRKDVLVPPTLRTPAFLTAEAHLFAAMSASLAVVPEAIRPSKASLLMATAADAAAELPVAAELPAAADDP